MYVYKASKAKLSLYRPDRLLGFQEVDAKRITRLSDHEGVKVVNLTHWPPLTPGNILGTQIS
jgi:hypothetical protein